MDKAIKNLLLGGISVFALCLGSCKEQSSQKESAGMAEPIPQKEQTASNTTKEEKHDFYEVWNYGVNKDDEKEMRYAFIRKNVIKKKENGWIGLYFYTIDDEDYTYKAFFYSTDDALRFGTQRNNEIKVEFLNIRGKVEEVRYYPIDLSEDHRELGIALFPSLESADIHSKSLIRNTALYNERCKFHLNFEQIGDTVIEIKTRGLNLKKLELQK